KGRQEPEAVRPKVTEPREAGAKSKAATEERSETGRFTVDGREFRVLGVTGDGDCLFASVLAGGYRQGVAGQVLHLDVPGLRDHVADWLMSEGADARTTVAELDELGFADLPDATDPEAWQRLGSSLLEYAPNRATAEMLGARQLVAAALRDTRLWNTPLFDHAPLVLARALDVNIRVVQEGVPTQSFNPGARGGTLYVHYNGEDHYQAMGPVEPVRPARPVRPAPPVQQSAQLLQQHQQQPAEQRRSSGFASLAERLRATRAKLKRWGGGPSPA
ncbi:hypothetical protein ADK38_35705, partial [Streptomyces varsoviensis]